MGTLECGESVGERNWTKVSFGENWVIEAFDFEKGWSPKH